MTFEQLTYFLEVARTQHVGKAAKSLAISPSAVSHSIGKLEEELGRNLFEKHGKRISLTGHGKLLMERAEKLLEQVRSVRDELQSDTVELRGHYRLAATHLLCGHYLAPAWSQVQTGNGLLTGEIFTLRSSQVVSGVASGEFDLGICFNPQPHPNLEMQMLRAGLLTIAVAKSHPLAKKRSADWLTKISQYPCVLPKAYQGIDVCERHPVFDRYQIKVRAETLIDSYEVALSKTASSQSWTLVPDWLVWKRADLVSLSLPKDWDAKYFVTAIWSKDRALTTPLKKLIGELIDSFQATN